jgi:ribosome-interacting GTPase 1
MPTNVNIHYVKAEQEYHEAETTQQKLKALKKMLAVVPKHKGTEKLQKEIKERMRRLKYLGEKEKKQKKRPSLVVKREGAAQIAIIGLPNSGKSTLLKKLSKKPVKIEKYPHTTKVPVVRMMPFSDIKLQGVEIPAIYSGVSKTPKGRQLLSIVRHADFVLIVAKAPEDVEIIKKELKEVSIVLTTYKKYEDFIQYLPFLTIFWDDFENPDLKSILWKKQKKMRVYTKTKDKGIAKKPIILKQGATVKGLAKEVHKDFLKKFRYAKVNGPSASFKNQQVGFEHKLKDKDVVEIFIK